MPLTTAVMAVDAVGNMPGDAVSDVEILATGASTIHRFEGYVQDSSGNQWPVSSLRSYEDLFVCSESSPRGYSY